MRSLRTILISLSSLLVVIAFIQNAGAADAQVGASIATSYIFRGASVNDGFVAQPYLSIGEFPEVENLTLGVWSNLNLEDDESGSPEGGHISEIDLYAAYQLPLKLDPASVTVGYTEYTYPRSDSDADRELNTSISFDALLNPAIGFNVGLDGGIQEQVYLDAAVSHTFELDRRLSLSLGAVGAFLFQGKYSEADDGFSYASINTTLSYRFISAQLAYFFETDDDVQAVDTELLGSIGVSLQF